MINFQSIQQMLQAATEHDMPLWECIQASDWTTAFAARSSPRSSPGPFGWGSATPV